MRISSTDPTTFLNGGEVICMKSIFIPYVYNRDDSCGDNGDQHSRYHSNNDIYDGSGLVW